MTSEVTGPRMGFVGVSTGGSSIMRVFPVWAGILGLPTTALQGYDLPLDAPPQVYRDVVTTIKGDEDRLGALVTTHKMAVFEHAGDLFDDLDDLANAFREISSVAKRDGRLTGAAKDPVTVRYALDEIVPAGHFRATGAAALILGSGGAGSALSYHLGTAAGRPSRIINTALRDEDLDDLRALHARGGIDLSQIDYVRTESPADVDALLAQLPSGSLVVNATGMGKDRPGSPLSDGAVLPEAGIVWEFNYRGSLNFLHQAEAQQAERRLTVVDGWRYFIHGWTQVIADVFDISMPRELVDELAAAAAAVR